MAGTVPAASQPPLRLDNGKSFRFALIFRRTLTLLPWVVVRGCEAVWGGLRFKLGVDCYTSAFTTVAISARHGLVVASSSSSPK